MDPISSLDDLIKKLGGPKVVAARCGVVASAVSNWLSRGRLPDRVSIHNELRAAAAEQGLDVSEAVFSVREKAA